VLVAVVMLKKALLIAIDIVNIQVNLSKNFQIIISSFIFLGKYFCRSCHSDKKSFLPSYIITKWDLSTKHSVSNFAFDYLNRIYSEPTFNLNDLNPKLFEKSKQLKSVAQLRWSLFYLRHYILTCRFAKEKG